MPPVAQERAAAAKAAENKRVEPRLRPSAVPITAVKLANGEPVELINVSRSGILIQGKTRFVAGTRLTLLFEGPVSPNPVRGKVVRCLVSSLNNGVLHYQSGVVFDTRVEIEHPGAAPPALAPEGPQTEGQSSPPALGVRPSAAGSAVRNRW